MPPAIRRLLDRLGLVRATRSFRHALVARRDARPGEEGGGPAAFTALGGVAGSTLRYPESARYFSRGYRYAQTLPHRPADGAGAPAAEAQENPLERFFDSYTEGPGIWKWRHYFDIYDRHLSRFRGKPVRMVEIGVFGGGSIRMWREYFGPQVHIYGIDIDESCRALEGDGVEIVIGDQSDPAFWESFLARSPAFDVVLDDGGHMPHQQMVTLECLLPALAPGGVFICEDVQGAFQPFHAFVDGLTHPLSGIGYAEQASASGVHDHVGSVHRYPLVTVIEKPSASAGRFSSERHGTDFPTSKWLA
jgi:hypothetical protein